MNGVKELLREGLIPFPVSEDALERTVARALSIRARRRRLMVATVAAGCSVLLVAVLFTLTSFSAGRPVPADHHLGVTLPPSHGPFAFGKRVSLEQAQAETPFQILLPTRSQGQLMTVWIEPLGASQTHVALDYSSGIEITEQAYTAPTDPRRFFQSLADEIGGQAAVKLVRDVPALVIPQDMEGQGNIGSVGLVLDGVYVVVYGHLSEDTLVGVASSLS